MPIRRLLAPRPCGACLACLMDERCARRPYVQRRFAAIAVAVVAAVAVTAARPAPEVDVVGPLPSPSAPVTVAGPIAIGLIDPIAVPTVITDTFDRDPAPAPTADGGAATYADWSIGPEDDLRCDPPGLTRSNALFTNDPVHNARLLARFDAVVAAGKVKGAIDGRRLTFAVPRYAAAFRAAGIRHRVDPIALVAVAWMESRVGHTRSGGAVKVNSVYAYGVMQVIGGTVGRRFGYDVRSLEGNINAGARYLRSLLAGPLGRYGIAFSFAGYFAGGAGAMRSGGVYDRMSPKTFEYGLNVRGVYDWLVAVGEGTYDPENMPQTGGYGAGRSAAYLTIRDGRDSARWRPAPTATAAGGSLSEMVVGMAGGAAGGSLAGCAVGK